jgi:carbonic anhydrase/acetyltransferase-like protein (isoleucine patch superfamily)
MIVSLGGRSPRIHPSVFVAPGAQIAGDVSIGAGSSVWFNAVLRADMAPIRIGKNSNIQDGAVLHTDPGVPCVVGDGVVIGHQATVHACRVGSGALIGIGARVLSGARVGRGALVGAGAVVREGGALADGMLAVGIPAKAIRKLTPAEKKHIAAGAARYSRLARQYRKSVG